MQSESKKSEKLTKYTELKVRSQKTNFNDEIIEIKSECPEDGQFSRVYVQDDSDDDFVSRTTVLKPEPGSSPENFMTVSGTIQRGKRKGEDVNVVLNMSREELEVLESNLVNRKTFPCTTEPGVGIHVFLWSVICLPISFVISTLYSFCIGTLTWYSIFTLFSDAQSLVCKILVPPLLIVLYPVLIVLTSLALGVYAGIKQLSCYWSIWLEEFVDYEKGFYGWLCNSLDLPECSPYEVVVLSGLPKK